MAQPETEAITNEETAIGHVASLLEPEGSPEGAGNESEGESEQVPQGEAAEEPAGEEEESEKSSEETDETEPEGEGEELPDTLEAFAEALGVEPDELAGHLKVPLKVNGKITHVPLAEAMKGARLEADYTQKTMELAEQKRQSEAQSQQAFERWQEQVTRLNDLIETFDEKGPTAEELASLMEDDPQEYLRAVAKQNARKEKLNEAKKVRDEELESYRTQLTQQLTKSRAEQQRLLQEKIPDLSETDKLRKFEDGLTGYLRTQSFSDEEIGQFFSGFDHRHILIARDAMRYRALQEGKKSLPKKLQGKSKVLKPGTASSKTTDTDKLVASRDRLRKLGKKGKPSRMQQEDAAIDMVKRILS